MKRNKLMLGIVLLLGSVTSGIAWADRGHGRVGIGVSIGVPLGGPWYYPPYYPAYYPPYYPAYYPPLVAAPASPPVYVEQGGVAPSASAQQSNYWYYCAASQTYYPYVKECPAGWLTVVPQAQPQPHP